MSAKFYKKASPKQPVYVDGRPVQFEKLNIELGVFTTEDVAIQVGFKTLADRGQGGVFEIEKEEYDALLEKKTTNSLGHYRDEFSKGNLLSKTLRPDNNLVTHAADEKPPEPSPVAPTAPGKVEPSKKPLPAKRAKQS